MDSQDITFVKNNAEGFAREICAIPVLQVEDMAKSITGKAMPIPKYRCLAPRLHLVAEPVNCRFREEIR